MTLQIEINNQVFVLHNTGALYWVEKRMLLISDVHLGKISHFRKHGLALPIGAIFKNFSKLDKVIDHFSPEKICFLGDLFHSSLNNEWHLFSDWVNRTELSIILVAGNHDVINPEKYNDLNIKVVSEWVIENFLLIHDPKVRDGLFTFSGHIHPSVRLIGKGRQFLKLSCFFRSSNQMILPAFGEFTGTYVMQPKDDDVVYVVTKEDIIMMKADGK
ncbi:ligase-associated DNA damage response endonuclease PdeM [Flavobacterium cerinum]|uniref:Ligase-associated DNA damage response endonuclease PdeM n=1 Tax=Flavobacterium cerinum TaxID=2502784 RepID=A0A3S3QEY2_9FLAO|nr:ligase-associated DNA damage response endonuclease PdeM [Flavobacterium cerinum]RWW91658.1 ligase-associated DNA damage response endonuclease PdeM [Flavobacterium cerinum]